MCFTSHKPVNRMSTEANVVIDAGTAFSVAGLLYLVSAAAASVHVLLNKENVGAAISWIGVIVLSPFFGVILYWLFGINRIRRRAQAEKRERVDRVDDKNGDRDNESKAFFESLDSARQQLLETGLSIHDSPYLAGNKITILQNGVEAFPNMLSAIATAQESIVLSSYIFEYDRVGKQFVSALSDAHERGVSVYVLIDGVGVGYGFSWAKADRVLRKNTVPTARFLPTFSALGTRFINLRNHRKILSVDGSRAFIGGMNIHAGNLLDRKSRHQTQDVHFCIEGPAINQINGLFEDDWGFATGETIALPKWAGETDAKVTCRVLLDGPDGNYEKLELTIVAAINSATTCITIATPYFLPDTTVVHALQLAVLRGVAVRLLLPAKSNLVFIDWAMSANESKLLKAGIKIYHSQPPFDHSKLFIVDSCWSLIGSSNWDARSLELNFEVNVECFDTDFAQQLESLAQVKLDKSSPAIQVDRHLFVRLRNRFVRLFTPYL